MKKITIIGAGLAGTLLALYLARRGYEIDVYESRNDMRTSKSTGGRSINLALSCRGITGLDRLDLMNDVSQIMVPMRARAIHENDGDIVYQAFGRHDDEHINAILRTDLNMLLLDKAELHPSIHLHFDMMLSKLDIHNQLIHFEHKDGSKSTHAYEHLIGADGAASKVRETLKQEKLIECMREFLPHGYKELSISREHQVNMAREHLHLWPRESFMLLGNPNRDDSITGSLFLQNQGSVSFETLDNESNVIRFFRDVFPDIYASMPNLAEEFLSNPTGNLSTIKCSPWYYKDQCLLLGDAAHGIVPFFGQGMNSAFEDCRILDELLEEFDDNWERVMPAFFISRKRNTDAIAEMSMDNYHEIQRDIADSAFNLKKQIEQELMRRYPEIYVSKHVMVMFTNTPYAEALSIGHLQTALLDDICYTTGSVEQLDWNRVNNLVKEYDKKMADIRSL